MTADQPTAPVRVVTIAFNPGPELDTFAATLSGATTRPVELVIVDNGTDPVRVDDVAERYAARLGVVYRHVFITSTQHADQREGRQRVDLRWRQANGPNGERYPHARAVFSNRGRSLRCIGRVDHFKHLGHLGTVFFREKSEGKQDRLHTSKQFIKNQR